LLILVRRPARILHQGTFSIDKILISTIIENIKLNGSNDIARRYAGANIIGAGAGSDTLG